MHKVANRINGLDGANELNGNSYQTLLTHVTHVTHTSLFAEYITHIAMKTRQFLVRRGVAVLHHKRRTPRDSTLVPVVGSCFSDVTLARRYHKKYYLFSS